MTHLTVVIVILLTSNLPSALCLLGEGLRGPPPCITPKTSMTILDLNLFLISSAISIMPPKFSLTPIVVRSLVAPSQHIIPHNHIWMQSKQAMFNGRGVAVARFWSPKMQRYSSKDLEEMFSSLLGIIVS